MLLLSLFQLIILSISCSPLFALRVENAQIVTDSGDPVQLRGVTRSGAEFMCIQNRGIFDGPTDAQSIQNMKAWNINIVRIPLNEDCWLDINGSPANYSGSVYHQAIIDYVNLLAQYGMYAILDLQWNAPGSEQSTGQNPMPDADHAIDFWKSVASTFSSNTSVIFDLFNEPYPNNNQCTDQAWKCWKHGGQCAGVSYTAAGMQDLVDAVRSVGAKNIVMLGGLQYSNCLTQWLEYMPYDPTGNIAASWHSYKGNLCSQQSCWDNTIAPVAQKVPVITGEIGETDCSSQYIDPLMDWLDDHGIHYLAWTWNTWGCSTGPCLVSDYNGTPTAYGQGFHDHLANIAKKI